MENQNVDKTLTYSIAAYERKFIIKFRTSFRSNSTSLIIASWRHLCKSFNSASHIASSFSSYSRSNAFNCCSLWGPKIPKQNNGFYVSENIAIFYCKCLSISLSLPLSRSFSYSVCVCLGCLSIFGCDCQLI